MGVEIEQRDVVPAVARFRCASTAAGPSPAPAVIYCHSGAFVLGNLDTDHRQCVEFARRGRLHRRLGRLPAGSRAPVSRRDSTTRPAVLEWVGGNAAELGIDATRLAVAGSSAGGALAARLAQRAADGSAPPVVFQLLHQPVLDDRPTPSKEEFGDDPGIRRACGRADVAALPRGRAGRRPTRCPAAATTWPAWQAH